jgi:hypothetical protein
MPRRWTGRPGRAHDSQISLHVHFAVVTEQQSVYASTEQGRRGLVVKEAVRSG